MYPDESTELQEGKKALKRINTWEERKEYYLFEAKIIMSCELDNTRRSKTIQQYPKVWDGVDGLKLF